MVTAYFNLFIKFAVRHVHVDIWGMHNNLRMQVGKLSYNLKKATLPATVW